MPISSSNSVVTVASLSVSQIAARSAGENMGQCYRDIAPGGIAGAYRLPSGGSEKPQRNRILLLTGLPMKSANRRAKGFPAARRVMMKPCFNFKIQFEILF